METIKIIVPVTFTGNIKVEVPVDVPQERRDSLARNFALVHVLTTTNNPDAPEGEACAGYEAEFGLNDATVEWEWDSCKTVGVSGRWSLQGDDDTTSALVTKLTAKAHSAGLHPEDLDETIHDLTSSTAADINNGGLDAQVRYLVKEMGTRHAEEQIDKLIAEKE